MRPSTACGRSGKRSEQRLEFTMDKACVLVQHLREADSKIELNVQKFDPVEAPGRKRWKELRESSGYDADSTLSEARGKKISGNGLDFPAV